MEKENKSVDELVKNVKIINEELNKIFDISCDESEISVYKSSLLIAKLDTLQLLLKETTDDLTNKRKRLFKLGFKIHAVELLLDVITIMLALTLGIVAFGFLVFNTLVSVKLFKAFNKSVNDTKLCDDTLSAVKEFDIVFENCYRLLKGHTNSELETTLEDINIKELRCIELANEHIEIAMISGVVDNIPDEVRNAMVMMLQDDLQTDEFDLIKLLEMANKKMEDESLVQADEMKLSRYKNSDFGKN